MMKHMDSESLAAKFARFCEPADAEGHVGWSGRRAHQGRPVIRHGGRDVQAVYVAFEQRTGRKPVGMCRADCDIRHCVAAEHVVDDLERRDLRLQLRAVYGRPAHWDVCPSGHSWLEDGRVEPDLTLYCRACNTDRMRRKDARNKAKGN